MDNQVDKLTKKQELDEKWNHSINSLSRYSGLIALLMMIMVPLVITIVYGENVDLFKTVSITISIMMVFAPVAIAENLSLYPILGVGGLVLSVVTGNVANMKLPAATSGMKIADAEIGTPEAEVASILSIGASAITTTVIVFLGMLFGAKITPILQSPVLAPGFAVVLPSLLGSMSVSVVRSSLKQTLAPLIFSAIVFLLIGKSAFAGLQGFILVVAMIISLIAVRIMYNKGIIKPAESKK